MKKENISKDLLMKVWDYAHENHVDINTAFAQFGNDHKNWDADTVNATAAYARENYEAIVEAYKKGTMTKLDI